MEVIVGAAVIIMLLLLAGVDLWYIFLGLLLLVAAAALFTAGFFIVCALMMTSAERRLGSFVRFEKNGRFDAAVYSSNGREYRNVFPAEFVMREKLYKTHTPVKLRVTKSGRAFDKNAAVTITAGLPLSLLTTLLFGSIAFYFLGII